MPAKMRSPDEIRGIPSVVDSPIPGLHPDYRTARNREPGPDGVYAPSKRLRQSMRHSRFESHFRIA